MRCHYEVLGIERDADDASIKKAYRKLALQLHPDKNPDRIEECTRQFHSVQAAYDVLSDKHERAFYDKHREAILKGGDDYVDESMDLMQYFNPDCYTGFSDDKNGFYSVYSEVFRKISEEEEPYLEGDEEFDVPEFGESTSDFESVVKPFYSYWLSYCTKKSFVWKDKYDLRQAPNRPTQRLMEKENRKIRDSFKKKRNEEVRALVSFVRKRDKRVHAYRKELDKKQEENRKKIEAKREKDRQDRNKLLENYEEQEWMSFDQSKLDDIDSHFDEQFGSVNNRNECSDDDSDFETVEQFHCIACDKLFKSEKALANHEKSKKHKENVELIRNEMKNDYLDFKSESAEFAEADIQNEDRNTDTDNISESIDNKDTNYLDINTPHLCQRLSSLHLPENLIKRHCIQKKTSVVNDKSPPRINDDSDSEENIGLLKTTDSIIHAKLKGKTSKGSVKVKEKKNRKGKSFDETESEFLNRHSTNFEPHLMSKDSLYLPRKKSKKQEIYANAERLRSGNSFDEDGYPLASLGDIPLTDSIKMSRERITKSDRKKGRRKLLAEKEGSESSSESSDNKNSEKLYGEQTLDNVNDIIPNSNGVQQKNNGTPLSRTVIADSIRYNKEKMEHHGKSALHLHHQKKFQEILESDEGSDSNLSRHNSENEKPDKSDKTLHVCGVCNKDYPSRNKLFDHIKAEGHAQMKDNLSSRKSKKSKKKK